MALVGFFIHPPLISLPVAYVITDKCTACDECIDECPIDAIDAGDPIYVINDTCCDFEECLAACPEDAIVQLEED